MKYLSIRTLLERTWHTLAARPRSRTERSRVRLRLDSLEERLTPAPVPWDGGPTGLGTDWHDPVNWVGDVLPGSADDAQIAPAFSAIQITSNADVTIRSVNSSASLRILGGVFSVAQLSSIFNNFTLSNGTLTGAGSFSVTGVLTWSGGAMTGSGQTEVNGTLTLDAFTFPLNLDQRTLVNNGTATLDGITANYLYASNGAAIMNRPGRTFTIQGGAYVYQTDSASLFTNQGTVRKTGAATVELGMRLANSGTVDVQAGTLRLTQDSSSSGTFQVAAGAVLSIDSGTCTLQAGASGTGTGLVRVAGGTLAAAANVTLQTLTLASGTLTGTGTLTVTGGLTWSGGQMTGSGQTVANGTLTLDAGANPLTLEQRTLVNNGTATFAGPASNYLHAYNGAALTNASGRTFTIQGAAYFVQADGTFTNQGTLRKAGTSSVEFGLALNNSGTVDVQAGTLGFTRDGAGAGGFQVAAGATLEFASGTFNLGGSISGAGLVVFSGATADLSGTYNVTGGTTFPGGTTNFLPAATVVTLGPALAISGGTVNLSSGETIQVTTLTLSAGVLTGSDTVTVSGQTTWSGGMMSGSGQTVANGTLTLNASTNNLTLEQRSLVNNGTASFIGGMASNYLHAYNGAALTNASGRTFTIQGAAYFVQADGTFTNQGTLRKTGVASVDFGLALNNSGTVDVQAGTLGFTRDGAGAGGFQVAAGATLEFASGTFNLGGSISGAGLVVFSGATADLSGTYNVTGGTTFPGGTTNFLPAATVVTLGPTLAISGGTVNLSSGETIQVTTLTLSAGVLTGSDTVTVSGQTTWSGGMMSGSGQTVANGTLTLNASTNNLTLEQRSLVNNGTASFIGGMASNYLHAYNGAALTNASGRTFTIQGAAYFVQADGTFTNQGTLRKTGVASVDFGLALNNSGTVDVQAGTLGFTRDGAGAGGFQVAAGATLEFASGTFNLGGSISGAGLVVFSGATADLSGTYNVTGGTTFPGGTTNFLPAATVVTLGAALAISGGTLNLSSGETIQVTTLTLSAGVLTGSDTVTVSGQTTWSGGMMSGSGQTVANGTLTLNASTNNLTLEQRSLVNNGTASFIGGMASNYLHAYNGAALTNASGRTFTIQGAAYFVQADGTFTNQGTLRKTGVAGVELGLVLNNSGTVEVQQGRLSLSQGSGGAGGYQVGTGATLAFVSGTFITGAFTNAGTVSVLPSVNVFVIAGYTQTAGSTLVDANSVLFALDTLAIQGGSLEVRGGGIVYGSAAITLAGNLTVRADSYVFSDGPITQTAGLTTLVTSGVLVGTAILLQGGVLSGNGFLVGDVTNAARITVGGTGAAGAIYVLGNYSQTGILDIELGGLTPETQHDLFYVEGTAALGGTLNVSLLGAYRPNPGDAFSILVSIGGITGNFGTITGLNLGGGLNLFPQHDGFVYYLFAF